MENSASKTVNSDTFQTVVNEERFQNLTNELRCLVCQNQTIAESNATLAVDLKSRLQSRLPKERVIKKFFNLWKSATANSYCTILLFLLKILYSGWALLSYSLSRCLFYYCT